MEKECTCKKLIKEDKITLITECNFCIKKRRKDLKSVLSILDKIIELKKLSIPKYKTGGVSCAIVNDSKEPTPKKPEDYKNWFVCDGKNTSVKDWLEADKELQRVCKKHIPSKTPTRDTNYSPT